MNLGECIRRNLIRKDARAIERVEKSVEISRRFLKSAKRNMEIEEYEVAVITAYNSIFHAARALLFKKGYVERSHTCLIIALRQLYGEDKSLMNLLDAFDRLRMTRHNIQYGGISTDREEAQYTIDFAENFLEIVENLLKTK
ncbi:MAG: DNA-binding protein [Thermotoga sp.]|nr:MAG: DNA-binding protein [Thermotoga sp.]